VKPFPVNNYVKVIFYNYYVQTEMTIYTNDSDDDENMVLARR